MDQIEKVARAICVAEKVNPDAIGYAITEETRSSLGAAYPLWKYRIPAATAALNALEQQY